MVASVIAVLIALLVMPGLALAQEAEEPVTSADPAEVVAPVEMAGVRLLHGHAHGPADFFVDGELLHEGLEFGQITDYLDVPAGKRLLQAVGEGMTTDQLGDQLGSGVFPDSAAATLKLKAGARYTAVANGAGPGIEIKLIQDKAKPKVGQAQARVVSLCYACGPMSYSIAGSKKPVAKYLHYPEGKLVGKYAKVKPGEVDLIPRVVNGPGQAADFEPVSIDPGTVMTLFVLGSEPASITLVSAVDAAISSARFMNASRVPPVLDVYVDGKKAAKRLGPGQSAPKVANLLSGEHLVQVVEVGSKPARGTLAEATVSFPAGAVAVEVGAGESIEAVTAPTSVVAKAKTPQVRFAHIDPEIPAVRIEIEGLDPVERLELGEWTDYITLSGDSSYLWIRPADDPNGIYHELPLDLVAGENYTAYLGGSATIPTVDLVIARDAVARKGKKG
ncbi:MAG: DUF4397 domain-containing protein [Chloroflexota bacterium]|nr:DUF4397 domain-containing protein [Chloroflexota bacterium]